MHFKLPPFFTFIVILTFIAFKKNLLLSLLHIFHLFFTFFHYFTMQMLSLKLMQ